VSGEIETSALLVKLQPYGATSDTLKYDCRHGYLAHPRVEALESSGRRGFWSETAVRRAKFLYRLRARGADGRTIRLLLFLHDGWGWEWIREDCITGVKRTLELSMNGIKRYAPSGEPDAFAIDNIREHQHAALVRAVGDNTDLKPTSEETTRFSVGLLRDGVPLEGGSARRLSEPLMRLFWPGIGKFETWVLTTAFDLIAGLLDLRADRIVFRVEHANAKQVERGRKSTVENLRLLRSVFRRSARRQTKGVRFNLLTMGGQISSISDAEFQRLGMSRYLVLAGIIGGSTAITSAIDEFIARWQPLVPSFSWMLLRMQSGDLPPAENMVRPPK
jgi:hypothetical protein